MGKTSIKPFLASLQPLKDSSIVDEDDDEESDDCQEKGTTTLHLWGAISRKGASPLQIFDGSLSTSLYLEILLENIVPFISSIKLPYRNSFTL